MNSFPVMSPYIALPGAFVLMVVVAIHAQFTRRSSEPASRKRVRLANAMLMMLTLPLVAVGFSVVDPRTHRQEWLLVWLAGFALLGMNVMLAVIDAANTIRLLRAARRRLRGAMSAETLMELRRRARARSDKH